VTLNNRRHSRKRGLHKNGGNEVRTEEVLLYFEDGRAARGGAAGYEYKKAECMLTFILRQSLIGKWKGGGESSVPVGNVGEDIIG